MRILASVALCALLASHACAGPRPKRTIRMLENFIETMRQTFSGGVEPAPPPPPEVIAKVTRLPYGTQYTYYPSVRMHIRPVEKHIIYVKPMPPSTPMTVHQMPSDVDIIRFVQPIVRMPKTKTTTTIHYEIIPVPVPVHTAALHEPVAGREQDERVPWSMDALPPPVPTSKPADPADEPLIPWNLHALPPPIATKRPHWQTGAEWTQFAALSQTDNHGNGFGIPLMQKKLVIPATGGNFGQPRQHAAFLAGHADKFVPSPLHSEVSVQPSLEIAAFSESVAQPQRAIFSQRKNSKIERQQPRLRRDTWSESLAHVSPESSNTSHSTNLPNIVSSIEYTLKGDRSIPVISSSALVPQLAFNARKFSKELPPLENPIVVTDAGSASLYDYEKFGTKTKKSNVTSQSTFLAAGARGKLPFLLDFGEYADNEDADKEDAHPAPTERRESRFNFTDDLVSIVRVPEWLSEPVAPDQFISITPKPGNYTRDFINASPAKLINKANPTSRQDFRDFNVNQSPTHEFRYQRQRDVPGYFDASKFISSRDALKLPETGLFSKGQDNYHDLFQEPAPSLADRYLSDMSTSFDWRDGNERRDQLPHFDYDNIEYFEPIVIDIDKERPKSADFASKLKYKYKSLGKPKSGDEPLKLPTSLHETVDYFKKRSMHPPIFDLEGDASESDITAIIDGNEIT